MEALIYREPGRRVQRAQARKAGQFKAAHARRRRLARFGKPEASDLTPGVTVTNPAKDRSLAGKARIRARRAARQIVAGFACSCGSRAYLTAGATTEDREWFDGLYDQHAACDDFDMEDQA